jgi:hypothetical protein
MILAPLAGIALVVTVATGPVLDSDPQHLSAAQKSAAVQPLITRATECIAHAVAANARYRDDSAELGELIVASVPSCIDAVRLMIDAYDRYFGDGTGEAFFMGPYLDVLPRAVSKQAKELRAQH